MKKITLLCFILAATQLQAQQRLFKSSNNYKAPVATGLVTNGLVLNLDASNAASYPGSGTTWTDLSGQNAHGTINGNVAFVSNGQASSFLFPTVDNVNSITSTLTQTYEDFTIVFLPDYAASNLITLLGTGVDRDYACRFDGWKLPNAGNGNDWTSSTAASYYVNGNLAQPIGSLAYIPSTGWVILGGAKNNASFSSSFNYSLGRGYPGRGFRGKIAVVLLYNRVLTAAEQQRNFVYLKSRFGL